MPFIATLLSVLLLTCGALADEPALSKERQKTALAVEALTRLQNIDLEQNAKLKQVVVKTLEQTRGTPDFVKLVKHFKLNDQDSGLFDAAIQNSTNETGVEAFRLLLAKNNAALLEQKLQSTNTLEAIATANLLGSAGEKSSLKLLLPLAADGNRDPGLRRQAIRSLAKSREGADGLLGLVRAGKLPEDIKFTAGTELSATRWPEINKQARELLPLPAGQNSQPLPPIAQLAKMKGDIANGQRVFNSPAAGCVTCHRVKGQGVDFGPDLTEIGTKLGKDALLESILDPSAGISFGYEAFQLQLKSGDEAYGLLASETADEIAIKAIGGIATRFKKADVTRREQMKLSIMPAGLQQQLSAQDLVDLVEYLASLKKPHP